MVQVQALDSLADGLAPGRWYVHAGWWGWW